MNISYEEAFENFCDVYNTCVLFSSDYTQQIQKLEDLQNQINDADLLTQEALRIHRLNTHDRKALENLEWYRHQKRLLEGQMAGALDTCNWLIERYGQKMGMPARPPHVPVENPPPMEPEPQLFENNAQQTTERSVETNEAESSNHSADSTPFESIKPIDNSLSNTSTSDTDSESQEESEICVSPIFSEHDCHSEESQLNANVAPVFIGPTVESEKIKYLDGNDSPMSTASSVVVIDRNISDNKPFTVCADTSHQGRNEKLLINHSTSPTKKLIDVHTLPVSGDLPIKRKRIKLLKVDESIFSSEPLITEKKESMKKNMACTSPDQAVKRGTKRLLKVEKTVILNDPSIQDKKKKISHSHNLICTSEPLRAPKKRSAQATPSKTSTRGPGRPKKKQNLDSKAPIDSTLSHTPKNKSTKVNISMASTDQSVQREENKLVDAINSEPIDSSTVVQNDNILEPSTSQFFENPPIIPKESSMDANVEPRVDNYPSLTEEVKIVDVDPSIVKDNKNMDVNVESAIISIPVIPEEKQDINSVSLSIDCLGVPEGKEVDVRTELSVDDRLIPDSGPIDSDALLASIYQCLIFTEGNVDIDAVNASLKQSMLSNENHPDLNAVLAPFYQPMIPGGEHVDIEGLKASIHQSMIGEEKHVDTKDEFASIDMPCTKEDMVYDNRISEISDLLEDTEETNVGLKTPSASKSSSIRSQKNNLFDAHNLTCFDEPWINSIDESVELNTSSISQDPLTQKNELCDVSNSPEEVDSSFAKIKGWLNTCESLLSGHPFFVCNEKSADYNVEKVGNVDPHVELDEKVVDVSTAPETINPIIVHEEMHVVSNFEFPIVDQPMMPAEKSADVRPSSTDLISVKEDKHVDSNDESDVNNLPMISDEGMVDVQAASVLISLPIIQVERRVDEKQELHKNVLPTVPAVKSVDVQVTSALIDLTAKHEGKNVDTKDELRDNDLPTTPSEKLVDLQVASALIGLPFKEEERNFDADDELKVKDLPILSAEGMVDLQSASVLIGLPTIQEEKRVDVKFVLYNNDLPTVPAEKLVDVQATSALIGLPFIQSERDVDAIDELCDNDLPMIPAEIFADLNAVSNSTDLPAVRTQIKGYDKHELLAAPADKLVDVQAASALIDLPVRHEEKNVDVKLELDKNDLPMISCEKLVDLRAASPLIDLPVTHKEKNVDTNVELFNNDLLMISGEKLADVQADSVLIDLPLIQEEKCMDDDESRANDLPMISAEEMGDLHAVSALVGLPTIQEGKRVDEKHPLHNNYLPTIPAEKVVDVQATSALIDLPVIHEKKSVRADDELRDNDLPMIPSERFVDVHALSHSIELPALQEEIKVDGKHELYNSGLPNPPNEKLSDTQAASALIDLTLTQEDENVDANDEFYDTELATVSADGSVDVYATPELTDLPNLQEGKQVDGEIVLDSIDLPMKGGSMIVDKNVMSDFFYLFSPPKEKHIDSMASPISYNSPLGKRKIFDSGDVNVTEETMIGSRNESIEESVSLASTDRSIPQKKNESFGTDTSSEPVEASNNLDEKFIDDFVEPVTINPSVVQEVKIDNDDNGSSSINQLIPQEEGQINAKTELPLVELPIVSEVEHVDVALASTVNSTIQEGKHEFVNTVSTSLDSLFVQDDKHFQANSETVTSELPVIQEGKLGDANVGLISSSVFNAPKGSTVHATASIISNDRPVRRRSMRLLEVNSSQSSLTTLNTPEMISSDVTPSSTLTNLSIRRKINDYIDVRTPSEKMGSCISLIEKLLETCDSLLSGDTSVLPGEKTVEAKIESSIDTKPLIAREEKLVDADLRQMPSKLSNTPKEAPFDGDTSLIHTDQHAKLKPKKKFDAGTPATPKNKFIRQKNKNQLGVSDLQTSSESLRTTKKKSIETTPSLTPKRSIGRKKKLDVDSDAPIVLRHQSVALKSKSTKVDSSLVSSDKSAQRKKNKLIKVITSSEPFDLSFGKDVKPIEPKTLRHSSDNRFSRKEGSFAKIKPKTDRNPSITQEVKAVATNTAPVSLDSLFVKGKNVNVDSAFGSINQFIVPEDKQLDTVSVSSDSHIKLQGRHINSNAASSDMPIIQEGRLMNIKFKMFSDTSNPPNESRVDANASIVNNDQSFLRKSRRLMQVYSSQSSTPGYTTPRKKSVEGTPSLSPTKQFSVPKTKIPHTNIIKYDKLNSSITEIYNLLDGYDFTPHKNPSIRLEEKVADVSKSSTPTNRTVKLKLKKKSDFDTPETSSTSSKPYKYKKLSGVTNSQRSTEPLVTSRRKSAETTPSLTPRRSVGRKKKEVTDATSPAAFIHSSVALKRKSMGLSQSDTPTRLSVGRKKKQDINPNTSKVSTHSPFDHKKKKTKPATSLTPTKGSVGRKKKKSLDASTSTMFIHSTVSKKKKTSELTPSSLPAKQLVGRRKKQHIDLNTSSGSIHTPLVQKTKTVKLARSLTQTRKSVGRKKKQNHDENTSLMSTGTASIAPKSNLIYVNNSLISTDQAILINTKEFSSDANLPRSSNLSFQKKTRGQLDKNTSPMSRDLTFIPDDNHEETIALKELVNSSVKKTIDKFVSQDISPNISGSSASSAQERTNAPDTKGLPTVADTSLHPNDSSIPDDATLGSTQILQKKKKRKSSVDPLSVANQNSPRPKKAKLSPVSTSQTLSSLPIIQETPVSLEILTSSVPTEPTCLPGEQTHQGQKSSITSEQTSSELLSNPSEPNGQLKLPKEPKNAEVSSSSSNSNSRRRSVRLENTRKKMPSGSEQDDSGIFCVCQRAAFGQMIACDDDLCPYQWFHYACVNITYPPSGKWYCKSCSSKRRPMS